MDFYIKNELNNSGSNNIVDLISNNEIINNINNQLKISDNNESNINNSKYYIIFINTLKIDPQSYFNPSKTIIYICPNNTDTLSEYELTFFIEKYIKFFMDIIILDSSSLSKSNESSLSDKISKSIITSIHKNSSQILIDQYFCINLKHRTDRKEHMDKQATLYGLNIEYYQPDINKNPELGCLKSHLEIIKMAKERKLKNICIFEDDCVFTDSFHIPKPPSDWNMLYLGGAVQSVLSNNHKNWKQVSTWYAHSYCVNETIMDQIIATCEQYKGTKTIDEIYCEIIHLSYKAYMLYPSITKQLDSYSDIEKREIDRSYKITNFNDTVEIMNKTQYKNNPSFIDHIYCINLENQKDRKKYMQQLLKKNNLVVEFFTAKLHENPEYGCLDSHVQILQDSKKRGFDNILIFEDDIDIIKAFQEIDWNTVPSNWDMLYFGGRPIRTIDIHNENWNRVQTWGTYAYMIRSSLFDKIIHNAGNYNKSIDRYYVENTQPHYNCYMINPCNVVVREGDNYSSIDKKIVNYDYLRNEINVENNHTQKAIEEQSTINNKNNKNNDSNLPYISIITPTNNRRQFFKLMYHNFININYPKDKIEWIIIDDGTDPIKNLIPFDNNHIKYYYFDHTLLYKEFVKKIQNINDDNHKHGKGKNKKGNGKGKGRGKGKNKKNKSLNEVNQLHSTGHFYKKKIPIGMKRNIGVKLSSHDIIVHMDDDDYYPSDSIKKRVQLLLQNKDKYQCVGCTTIPSFNINKYISAINAPPLHFPLKERISEATLTYFKSFWTEQRYDNQTIGSEATEFLNNREDKCMEIDYTDIIVSLLHKNNMSSRNIPIIDEPNGWHFSKISDKFFIFLTSIDE
jgi:glutaredoxin-related protein